MHIARKILPYFIPHVENTELQRTKPVGTNMKERIDLTIDKAWKERLLLLAKLFNRSRSNEIEELIKAECKKWNIPPPDGDNIPIPLRAQPKVKAAVYHSERGKDRLKRDKGAQDSPRSNRE